MSNFNNSPWWSTPSGSGKNISLRSALTLSLIVGVIGGILGAASSGSLFGYSTRIVSSQSTIERPADSVAGIAARVLPSVVSIEAKSVDGGSTGSGFVISPDGYILTNNHVIAAAIKSNGAITIRLQNGESYRATVIGGDSTYDLAVLQISNRNLPALQFGDSEKVAVGDAVLAIGSPLGLSGTVTSGIISAKDRAVTAGENAEDNSFIGSVFNSQTGSIGLGFAIPINQARKTAEQLIKSGKSTYPILGVSVAMNYQGVGAQISLKSNAILPGGPASKVGLQAGDVITQLGDRVITSAEELIVAVRSHDVGESVVVTYTRKGKSASVTLVLTAGK